MYDNNGDAFGFQYGGKEYFYVKNLQNDITAITDSAAKVIANYYYDAWGNITEITGDTAIANINPLRYRSYYYDTETELYYLNTRYYSPDMCRFLNADGYIQTGQGVLDKNMFAYCENSPVTRLDSNGDFWLDVKDIISNATTNLKQSVANILSNKDRIAQSEHHKKGTVNEHNRNKHEKGQSRKQRDNNGEKGDVRRKPNPNKRRSQNIEPMVILEKVICSAVVIVSIVAIAYLVLNDTTIIGVLDDSLIGVLIPIMWENATKVVT